MAIVKWFFRHPPPREVESLKVAAFKKCIFIGYYVPRSNSKLINISGKN